MARPVIHPGSLRHIVTVQTQQEATNEFGEVELTWVSLESNVRASIEPLSGRELFNAQQVQSDVSTRIRLRWFDGLTSRMRIVWGSRVFQIESAINEQERNVVWTCLCREAA